MVGCQMDRYNLPTRSILIAQLNNLIACTFRKRSHVIRCYLDLMSMNMLYTYSHSIRLPKRPLMNQMHLSHDLSNSNSIIVCRCQTTGDNKSNTLFGIFYHNFSTFIKCLILKIGITDNVCMQCVYFQHHIQQIATSCSIYVMYSFTTISQIISAINRMMLFI